MTDLVSYTPRPTSLELAPQAWALAEKISSTDFVPTALRGRPEAVLACILAGHEAGVSPMQALAKIHIIEGRPAMSAELMRALVLQHGHSLDYEELTTTSVTAVGQRSGSSRTTKITWTIDDAKKAGLAEKAVWRKYPMDMLIARTTGRLCRLVFPDVLAGISYTPEELEDGGELDFIPGQAPAAPTPQRATARAAKRATRTTPPSAELPAPPPPTAGAVPDLPDPLSDTLMPVIDPSGLLLPELPEDNVAPAVAPVEPSAPAEDWPSGDWPSGDFPDTPTPADERSYTGPQLIAIRLGRFGIKGNSAEARQQRLDVIGKLIGRTITSSKELSPEEIHELIAALDLVPEGTTLDRLLEAAGAPDAPVEPEAAESPRTLPDVEMDHSPSPVVDAQEAPTEQAPAPPRRLTPSPEAFTAEDWRALLVARKVKVTELMRAAQHIASNRTPAVAIGVLDDITGSGIAGELLGWLEDLSLERRTK